MKYKKPISNVFRIFTILLFFFGVSIAVIGCGGGGDGEPSNSEVQGETESKENKIFGRIIDETGNGVANAKVYTVPATGTATTDSSGNFIISDGTAPEMDKIYTVYVERAGYTTASTTITIAAGFGNQANMEINSKGNGLVASDENGVEIDTLIIGKDETSTSFLLTSTVDNNTFQFSTIQDWLTISPTSGQIDKKTTEIIKVTADKSGLPDGESNATIIGNGNTEQGINLNVRVAKNIVIEPPIIDPGPDGVTPQPPPGTPFGDPITARGYTVTPGACELIGSDMTCNFSVMAVNKDADIRLYTDNDGSSSRAINNGNVYDVERVTLGSDSSTWYTKEPLKAGTAVNGSVTLANISSGTQTLDLLLFEFRDENNEYFELQFRDAPVNVIGDPGNSTTDSPDTFTPFAASVTIRGLTVTPKACELLGMDMTCDFSVEAVNQDTSLRFYTDNDGTSSRAIVGGAVHDVSRVTLGSGSSTWYTIEPLKRGIKVNGRVTLPNIPAGTQELDLLLFEFRDESNEYFEIEFRDADVTVVQ